MANFELADTSVAPGELAFARLEVGENRDGSTVFIPLMVMNGIYEGPKLWICNAIHGDEIAGVEVIRRIMREEINPKELHGVIVAAPVLNPFAFNAGSWGTPYAVIGNTDAHSVFPGNPKGVLNERLAYRIFTEGVLRCDYVIDIHSNFYPAVEFIALPVSQDEEVLEASIAAAEACGLPLSEVKADLAKGWISWAAQGEGKPAFTLELLAQGYLDARSIRIGVLGILNVLRHLKMLEGEAQPLPDLKVSPGRYGREFVTANRGGLIHFHKEAGDWIEANEIIATIRNVYGDIVEEVEAPTQGYIRTILFGPHNEAVYQGTILASILASDPNRHYFYDLTS